MLTVVDELGNDGPRWWQEAAKVVVCEIFNDYSLEKIIHHLECLEEEWQEMRKNEEKLSMAAGQSARESQKFLSSHFDGMLNNYKFFTSDGPYWVDEWRQLGCLSAAAGIKNGNFLAISEDLAAGRAHPENEKKSRTSASAEFDSWMVRDSILETLIRKQKDYGHENISRFGRYGLLVRTHDKLARLINLQKTKNNPENESITDTYTDIVGYSAIGMMLERGWFGLPLIEY